VAWNSDRTQEKASASPTSPLLDFSTNMA
jgi:hypothetical protein